MTEVHARAMDMRPDAEDLQKALRAADTGDAFHWPMVADVLAAEVRALSAELERVNDALAEADQTQQRSDDQRGDTRDGVMQAIEEAGLAPHVCDDDDLPDMVRHALAAAKKLAQPALWTYNDRGEPVNEAGAAR